MHPLPPDQDLMALNNLPAATCAAAAVGRWIKMQRAGLDPTRVNTSQTGIISSFCRKTLELFLSTKISIRNSKFFAVRSFCYV
jgi:hypothetical protein